MKNVLEYIEHSAELYADKTAIADENKYMSYGQLLEFAQKAGSCLAKRLEGVRNKPIAVLLAKEAYSVAAFMGVVYSGNFYVVIDDQMPVERINSIFETLKPVAIITDEKHTDTAFRLSHNHIFIVTMEEIHQLSGWDKKLLSDIRNNMIDTDPVYALFTSGSTGVPKGAVINHRNILS